MRTIQVQTQRAGSSEQDQGYAIIISDDYSGLADEMTRLKPDPQTKICIVTDSNVKPLYANTVKDALQKQYSNVFVYDFPSGEENKNLDTVASLYEYLIRQHFDRKDVLIALGGGVVGDLTGFTAATYLRGIDFIQMPTTLLSQVDSSVGGKTGVDFLRYKNMVGAFYMPKLVMINISVLTSLPEEQFASGMAEVIKYGLIQKKGFYEWLIQQRESIVNAVPDVLAEMIYTSCDCKREVVEEDPTEKGLRAILNFGHTIGHAIEKMSEYRLFHGQCVAIGMVAAAYLSQKRGYLSSDELENLCHVLSGFSLPTSASQEGLLIEDVFSATKSDKKMAAGQIRFVLLEEIGKAIICQDVGEEELKEAITFVLT